MKLFNLVIFQIHKWVAYAQNAYLRKSDARKAVYEIKDSYRNGYGQQIVVAKIIDSPRGLFKMPATELVLRRKDILYGFSIDDVVNIVGLATVEKETLVTEIQPTAYKYYAPLAMLFGAVLIIANVASSKLISFFGMTMTGGTLAYPLAYILGDIITEVYGYKRARQLIWGAMLCNILLVFFLQLTIMAPPSIYWHNQSEYALILGAVPRIVFASLIAYWTGEFLNSYVIAKFKIAYNGQNLFGRIASSSMIGITTDTLIFILVAYSGVIPLSEMLSFSIRVYVSKLLCEFLAIPITMWIINQLKVSEQLDIYDINTDFTPFSIDVSYSSINNRMSQELSEEVPMLHPSVLVK